MKVIEIAEPGGPEVLRLAERPVPEPGYGEVRLRVAYAGVNRPDALQRAGGYQPPPGASDLPGLEASGTIDAVGPGVSGWSAGDRVCALLPGGGYAEYVVTPAAQCLPIPKGLGLDQAACLPETFFTVWTNVFQRGALGAGETFLVHGGTSGIGTTAIQIAHVMGARVFATAGTNDKCRFCEKLGAERGINYRTEDFVSVVTDAGGADVILDMVGGDYVPRNLTALKDQGRLVFIAALAGQHADIDIWSIMARGITVTGSLLRPQSVTAKARIADDLRRTVWPFIEAGRIVPVIDQSFPLAEAAAAHRALEADHIGKIVLEVAGG
ncbi:MAG: NAD(P)H-quinone oxidoreductase [Pseudomonadota bacterium]